MAGLFASFVVGTPAGARAPARVFGACLVLLGGACSGVRPLGAPDVSRDVRTRASEPHALPSVSPGVKALDRAETTPEPFAGESPFDDAFMDGPATVSPAVHSAHLNPELCRLRNAARRQLLGREHAVGSRVFACSAFEADSQTDGGSSLRGEQAALRNSLRLAAPRGLRAVPSSRTTADQGTIAPNLGSFVPIEHEEALAGFQQALARLAAGADEDGKVRVLAYGASHTQADVYPGYLRAYLQRRFGDGGRGFVPLGRVNAWHRTLDTGLRHRALTVHRAGSPKDGSDEPLGLFGAALVGRSGNAFGEITTADDSPNTRFEVHYLKQPGGGDFSLYVDGTRVAVVPTRAEKRQAGYHAFETTPGRHQIRTHLRGNGPVRLFGVVAETATPGVVVDTLGIGGARMASHLRWSEERWIEAVRRRSPDLVTFAYGTNEATDKNLPTATYEGQLRAVLARLRRALPDVSCLLISPFDLPAPTRARLVGILETQRRVSSEFGCGFWDAHAFMGGKGSIQRWASTKPPLASADHVHLTHLGYVYAGIAIGDALMRAYDRDPAHFGGSTALTLPPPPASPLPDESSGSGSPSILSR